MPLCFDLPLHYVAVCILLIGGRSLHAFVGLSVCRFNCCFRLHCLQTLSVSGLRRRHRNKCRRPQALCFLGDYFTCFSLISFYSAVSQCLAVLCSSNGRPPGAESMKTQVNVSSFPFCWLWLTICHLRRYFVCSRPLVKARYVRVGPR